MKQSDNIGLGAATENAARATEDATLAQATEELRTAGMLPCTLREIMATKYPPPDWIVKDLIAARGATSRGFKGDLIAPPKTGKTLVGLGLFACASAGREWFGLEIPRPFKCLYLDLELREDFNRERLEKIAIGMGANLDNLAVKCIADPYNIRNRFDRNGKLIEGMGHEDALITWIRGMGFEFVALDSQYKLLIEGEDENSGEGMAGIMHLKDRIITETAAALLVVHHDNKSGGEGKAAWQRGAGSGFLGRDYDYRITLDENADGIAGHEVIGFSSRYRIPPADRTIVRDNETLIFSVAPDIAPKRMTQEDRNNTSRCDTTSAAARSERERAEAAARSIFNDLDTQATEVARKERRDPIPRDYLLDKETFKNRLRERAGIGIQAAQSQMKTLCEPAGGKAATLETIPEKEIKKDGTIGNAYHGATFIGFPSRIGAYARHFEELSNQHK